MVSQFNEVLEQKLFAAAADDAGSGEIEPGNVAFVEQALLDYLAGLEVGRQLSSSPLIKVIAVDDDSVTFLIRGRMKINRLKERFSPFVRIEARVLKTDTVIDAVTTFIADLKITESDLTPVTEVRMGLGFDGVVFSGRGGAKVTPIGFGLDIFLGGVSDRGIMIGINVFLPVPTPLGPIPFGLNGIGGEYAHNFKPRIEAGLEAEGPKLNLESGETPEVTPGGEIQNPTAIHYLQWARNPDDALDRWIPAPADETAIGLGVRCFMCDVLSNGNLLLLEPVGFAVLTPGPVIILGGEGKLLNADLITIDALAVIDANSNSFAMGGGAEVLVPNSGSLVQAAAIFEAFFSRSAPTTWFVRLGSAQAPATAQFLSSFSAKLYFELNHYHVTFGLGITWKESFRTARILEFSSQGNGNLMGLLGWNPRQLVAEFRLTAEGVFKVWKFKMTLSLEVKVLGHLPQPKMLEATTTVKLKLPFPLGAVEVKLKLPRERENQAPDIALPLGEATRAGALHPISGRQWDLSQPSDNAVDQPWPDVDLTIPFTSRLINQSGQDILGTPVGPEIQGGYNIYHRLTQLELTNLTTETTVDGVQAVWAEGPDGETTQLHVLAQDPYSWLSWNESVSSSLDVPEPATSLQRFGIGAEAVLDGPRRFGQVMVEPASAALLNNNFDFALPHRVISGSDLTLKLRTAADEPIAADWLRLYFIEQRTLIPTGDPPFIDIPGAPSNPSELHFVELFPTLYLVTYVVPIPSREVVDEIRILSLPDIGGTPRDMHLYGVAFREVAVPQGNCQEKVILSPGRYRLEAQGVTAAVALDDFAEDELAEPEAQKWARSWEFDVVYPNSLRPYLRDTTVGDSRIIRDEAFPWNPTLFGVGFSAYRGYLPAVRFVVPYLSSLFPSLRYRLVYEAEGVPNYSFTAAPTATANGENSLLEPSKDFLDWVGCPINPDEEIEGPEPLPTPGPAEVQLIFDEPGGNSRRLDSWSCYVSQFSSFKEHLTLAATTLSQVYDAQGPRMISPCFVPDDIGFTTRRSIGGGRMDPVLAAPVAAPRNPTAPLLPADYPLVGNEPFPEELATPPMSWWLPSAMAQHLDHASVPLPVAFARFARASGVVFYDMPSNPHFGLANPTEQTTVEAIVDEQGRPFALWLRTPEPVDWRRVTAELKIRHLKDEDGCSSEYAFRKPLDLTVDILPGPDASSAFIVGSFAQIRTRLPRGEYELTLGFDSAMADLPRLRPGPQIEGPKEMVMLKFLQISGEPWPRPETKMVISAIAMETILMATAMESPAIADLLATPPPAAPAASPASALTTPPSTRRGPTLTTRNAKPTQREQPRRRRPRVTNRANPALSQS